MTDYRNHPDLGVREGYRRLVAAAGYLTARCACGHVRLRHECPPNVGDEGDGGACGDCPAGVCDGFREAMDKEAAR